MRVILMIFSKKRFACGKWTILDPKMVHPHSSESTVRIFFKILRNEKVGDESNNNDR